MLTHGRFSDFGGDFMRVEPRPLEMTDVDVERACPNHRATVHVLLPYSSSVSETVDQPKNWV